MAALPAECDGHLGDLVSGYVDCRLPEDLQLACAQHVTVCPRCAQAAAEEAQLLAALRRDDVPGMSAALSSSLLELGGDPTCVLGPSRLATLSSGAPPMHRSARRALAVAAVAASVCGLGAWTITGSGPDRPVEPVVTQPAATPPVRAGGDPGGGSVGAVLPVLWPSLSTDAVTAQVVGNVSSTRHGQAQSRP